MPPRIPTIVIVGRPNVGKSTLVNRIVGRRVAVTEERPGVTRDRKEVEAEWQGQVLRVVDTGGWLPGGDELDHKVSRMAERAMEDADLVLLVADVTTGLTDEDDRVGNLLRRRKLPTLVVVNKVDDAQREADAWAFAGLGLGDPFMISALHGRGAGDLLDEVVARVASKDDTEDEDDGEGTGEPKVPAIAIVGRPNVGKSTLFNRLIGDDRSIVHDLPGTTRDTVDTLVEWEEGPVRFIDTAGMRRRSRVDESAEFYANLRALDAVDRADAALLVIDAAEGVTHQDQRLAERVDGAGCPLVVLLNKWETLDADQRRDVQDQVADRLRFLAYAPVLNISALTGKGCHRLRAALLEAIGQYGKRVPTADLNRAIRDAQAAHPAPGGARVLYATQGASDPPTFTLFVNKELPRTYLRFLENRLRDHFGFDATPIKLRVRQRAR